MAVLPRWGIPMGRMYVQSKSMTGGVAVNTASRWQKETKRNFLRRMVLKPLLLMKIVMMGDFVCGSDMEICPDSENEENSDIDISEQLQSIEIERKQHEAIATGTVSCIY